MVICAALPNADRNHVVEPGKGRLMAQGGPRNLARVQIQEVTAAAAAAAVDVLLKGLVKTIKALVGLSKAM